MVDVRSGHNTSKMDYFDNYDKRSHYSTFMSGNRRSSAAVINNHNKIGSNNSV